MDVWGHSAVELTLSTVYMDVWGHSAVELTLSTVYMNGGDTLQ